PLLSCTPPSPLPSLSLTSLLSPFSSFFNHTAITAIYTLSLPTLYRSHRDAVALLQEGYAIAQLLGDGVLPLNDLGVVEADVVGADRKSTRLNSSHVSISYAVFCLKKKKNSE